MHNKNLVRDINYILDLILTSLLLEQDYKQKYFRIIADY